MGSVDKVTRGTVILRGVGVCVVTVFRETLGGAITEVGLVSFVEVVGKAFVVEDVFQIVRGVDCVLITREIIGAVVVRIVDFEDVVSLR